MSEVVTPESPVDGSDGSETDTSHVDAQAEAVTTGDGDRKMPREQRYRLKLRAAEAERDSLRERLEGLQRREVERLASDLAQPGDLFELGGVSLSDLLTEAGDVDSAAVAEAVAALIESRPLLAKNPRMPAYDITQGLGNGGSRLPADWASFLSS